MSPTRGAWFGSRYSSLLTMSRSWSCERRRHALALDARDLESERDDERGVDGGRDQRLEPGDQFFADPRQRSWPIERRGLARRVSNWAGAGWSAPASAAARRARP